MTGIPGFCGSGEGDDFLGTDVDICGGRGAGRLVLGDNVELGLLVLEDFSDSGGVSWCDFGGLSGDLDLLRCLRACFSLVGVSWRLS